MISSEIEPTILRLATQYLNYLHYCVIPSLNIQLSKNIFKYKREIRYKKSPNTHSNENLKVKTEFGYYCSPDHSKCEYEVTVYLCGTD
jgi:hypothetical protein